MASNSSSPSEQPLLNYGKMLIDENRSEEAVKLLSSAVDIAPGDAKCHEQLARALEETSKNDRNQSSRVRIDRAQAEMIEAIRLDPTNARQHFQLSLMYRRGGQGELAREQAELSRKLYGSHSTSPDN